MLALAAADALRYVMRSNPLVLTVPWRTILMTLRKRFRQSRLIEVIRPNCGSSLILLL
jgi:hypothetical protein